MNKSDETSLLLELSNDRGENWKMLSLESSTDLFLNFRTLDSIVKELNINYNDFLRINVQGAEFLVLEGALRSLSNKRIN